MDFVNSLGLDKSWDMLYLGLPFVFFAVMIPVFWDTWKSYVRNKFLSTQNYVLLHIVPPKEVLKTPAAMELLLLSLWQTAGETTWIDRYLLGKVRAWFALEIASIGGRVGFYIWTRENLSKFIQSQIYAQYPGAEITVINMEDDYTNLVEYPSSEYEMFGIEYKLTEPDPVPIKTYVDYGLDKVGDKEVTITDPITPVLEFLGSIGQGENLWIQILIRAHKKEDKDKKNWFKKTDYWKDEAKELIEKIRKESVTKTEGKENSFSYPNPTKGQMEKIYAIERSVSKYGFDVGIRSVYIAEKERFNGMNIGGLIGAFKQYSSASLNGFGLGMTTSTDYPWEDMFKTRIPRWKKKIFEHYKAREYFFSEIKGKKRKKMVLNSEELATIFHFPGQSVQTPTMTRVQSKKNQAPDNLPVA